MYCVTGKGEYDYPFTIWSDEQNYNLSIAQNHIGWDNFIEGKIAMGFRKIKQDYS